MSVLASYLAGKNARREQDAADHTQAQQHFLKQNGSAIMAGDQGALGGLAGFDPALAMNINSTQQANRRANAQEGRARQQFDMQMDAAEAAQAAAELEQGIQLGLATASAEEWDALMQQNEATQPYVGQWEQREQIAQGFLPVVDQLKMMAGPDPAPAPHIRQVTGQEAAALGGDPTKLYNLNEKTGQLSAIGGNSLFGSEGISVTSPDGTVIQMGGEGADQGIAPTSPAAMVASIDGILNDPALDYATGFMAWTQKIPGTEARRFGARAKQLEGQAFLQAFEALKGGGQITQIEGEKATQAIGRLDTAQKPEDYRAALEELRAILLQGMSRPQGWADTQQGGQQPAPTGAPEVGFVDDGYRFLGGDPSKAESWQKVSS